jgi:PadR family transcriptional regulator, regulatory protein PadR
VTTFGLERTDPGGLYRTLRAMEQEGLVDSKWEESEAGPARRRYRLTDEGLEWLHASAGSLREVVRHLMGYLDRYDAFTGGGAGARTADTDGAIGRRRG